MSLNGLVLIRRTPVAVAADNSSFQLIMPDSALFSSCIGRRKISEILENWQFVIQPTAVRYEFGPSFFERMWKLGHLWILAVP